MRHGFIWLLAAFTSAGGMFQGYAIGLVTGLSTSSTFVEAFPSILPRDTPPAFVLVFTLGAAVGSCPLIAGAGASIFGRKATIIASAAVGVAAGVLMAATPSGNVVWLCSTRCLSAACRTTSPPCCVSASSSATRCTTT